MQGRAWEGRTSAPPEALGIPRERANGVLDGNHVQALPPAKEGKGYRPGGLTARRRQGKKMGGGPKS